jgi:hypothetical protein
MYRQLRGLNDMHKKVYRKNASLGLVKLTRTRKRSTRDRIRRRNDLGASSALWETLITINPSTYTVLGD